MSFSSFRRDFLRTGGLGLAGISLPSFALAASEPHGPTPHQPVFNVRSYGAKGDGKTVDTAAVNRAIEAAVAKKGGIVFFPMGTYLCFSIHLKSYVHLYLDQGAIILAADSPLARPTNRLQRWHIRPSRAQHSLGVLSGLRPQSLAQLPDVGRGHSQLQHDRPRPHLG